MSTYAGLFGSEAILKDDGTLARAVPITVYDADGVTPSSIYTDHLRTASAANPVITHATTAALLFYAEPGLHYVAGTGINPSLIRVDEWQTEPPDPHAATHAIAGGDLLTPGAIGADVAGAAAAAQAAAIAAAAADATAKSVDTLATISASGASRSLSFLTDVYHVTMDQACSFSFQDAVPGTPYFLRLVLDGAFSPSFPGVSWADGSIPTYGSPSIYEFLTVDGGSTIYGALVGKSFASVFTFADIAGLVLWTAATDAYSDLAGTVPATAGGTGTVARLTDRSGAANHLTNATAGGRPGFAVSILNGQPVVRFDPAATNLLAKVLASAFVSPVTIFMVAKSNSKTNYRPLIASQDPAAAYSFGAYTATGTGKFFLITNASQTGPSDVTGAFDVFEAVFNGASSLGLVNGAAHISGDTGTLPMKGFLLGQDPSGTFRMDGDIAEVVVYNSALSATDRSTVRHALGARYAIAVS